MKSKTLKLALACGVITATSGFAQTNIPTDAYSAATGTFNFIGAPRVVGNDPATAYVRYGFGVASTVFQAGPEIFRTNRPNLTVTAPMLRYSFGNLEILQLTLGTRNIAGWSLVWTNRFDNPDEYGFAAVRGSTVTPVPESVFDLAFAPNQSVNAQSITFNTNTGVASLSVANIMVDSTVRILDAISAGGLLNGSVNLLNRKLFTSPTRTNVEYASITGAGTFAGIWQEDVLLPNVTNTFTAIAGTNFSLNYEGVNISDYGLSNAPAGFTINGNGSITGSPTASPSVLAGTNTAFTTNTVTVVATNAVGQSDSRQFRVVVRPQAPNISSGATVNATTNTTVLFTNTTTLTNAASWSIFPTNLPTGVSFNTNTGVITAASPASGTNSFQISASNAAGVGTKIIEIAVP